MFFSSDSNISMGSNASTPKPTLNQILDQWIADFWRLSYSQSLELNLEILGYTEQVNAAIGTVTTFDEDQLDKDLNDEIEKFSNLLNKAYRLKQRNNTAKGIITQANSNTQSGILKLEKNKKSVNKAHEDNKQFETIFVDLSKKKHDLKTKILELQNWLKILKSEEKNLRASTTSNTKLENDMIETSRTLALSINEQIKKKEKAEPDLVSITKKWPSCLLIMQLCKRLISLEGFLLLVLDIRVLYCFERHYIIMSFYSF